MPFSRHTVIGSTAHGQAINAVDPNIGTVLGV